MDVRHDARNRRNNGNRLIDNNRSDGRMNRPRDDRSPKIQRVNFQPKHLAVIVEPAHFTLSTSPSANYMIDGMIPIKEQLNDAKSRLDKYYLRSEIDPAFSRNWNYFSKIVDTYSDLKKEVSTRFNAKHVTNAWVKYWELYKVYDLEKLVWAVTLGTTQVRTSGAAQGGVHANPTQKVFNAFFNAELPGAALSAFYHFMKTLPDVKQGKVKFEWYASSYIPTEVLLTGLEQIEGKNVAAVATTTTGVSNAVATSANSNAKNDQTGGPSNTSHNTTVNASSDRPSTTALGDQYGFLACNRSHWLMGPNYNGDAMDLKNIIYVAETLGPKSTIGGVDFYSHDAGIDVSTDAAGGLGFNDQELANAKLHLGCALTGLLTLRPGGMFIAKQYTFFETFTWNLIILYSNFFSEFYISKPLTSRPGNSEIYLIGKNFTGITKSNEYIINLLKTRLADFNTLPFIPQELVQITQLSEIIRFARIIYNQQKNVINENTDLFEKYQSNLSGLKFGLLPWARQKIDAWLTEYTVRRIDTNDQLASK